MKLCVFPADSLKTSFEKGEIKERYYNPKNFFDEVHFITFEDREVDKEKIRFVVGNAKVLVHAVGKLSLLNPFAKKKQVLEMVRKIRPDVIRAFRPTIHGYYAAYCAKKLKIPYVISIHGDFDRDARFFYWKTGQYKTWIKSVFEKHLTEKFAIKNADQVICAYSFPVRYAKEYGAKSVEVIYNKVYAENFVNAKPPFKLDKPVVICVGRLIAEKNQECLMRAMQEINGYLILIGNGPLYGHLVELAKSLGVQKKVLFFTSVPNKEIPSYYASADVFALPIKYGGVAIPVIEAMAAGLPIIVAKPELDPTPEISSEVGLVVENTPDAFAQAIKKILGDKKLRRKMIQKGRRKFAEIEGRRMEEKEALVYKRLVKECR